MGLDCANDQANWNKLWGLIGLKSIEIAKMKIKIFFLSYLILLPALPLPS